MIKEMNMKMKKAQEIEKALKKAMARMQKMEKEIEDMSFWELYFIGCFMSMAAASNLGKENVKIANQIITEAVNITETEEAVNNG